jgi:LysR family nitrogen assimilation transcriptional regulator
MAGMDLRQLSSFVQVAELGSFTRAAAVLRVAQPALSRQVRALEVELRQTLFERNGRGVTLTPAGTRLLAHGRGILQQVQRAVQDLEEQRGAATGMVSIGLPPTLSRTLTAPLVEAFRERFPRAGVSVVEGLTHYMLEWLVQGRIDAALVYNATRELVIPSRPHALRMRVETALAEAGLTPRVALEIESVGAMLALVQRHPLHAVLAVTALQGQADGAQLQARPILIAPKRPLTTSLSLATSAQRPRGPLLEQAAALLAQLAQAANPP